MNDKKVERDEYFLGTDENIGHRVPHSSQQVV